MTTKEIKAILNPKIKWQFAYNSFSWMSTAETKKSNKE